MTELFKDYPDVVSVIQMAEMLQIGSALAYRLVSSGTMKSRKIGRDYKISKATIIEFVHEVEKNDR